MCGRYTQTANLEKLAKRFGIKTLPPNVRRRYNIAPTQEAPVIVREEGRNTLKLMRWGLVPSWAKDVSIGNRMINARAETLAEKPSFKKSFQQRRCLVLADGFYEWRPAEWQKRKIPVRIVLKTREPFAFAGLWACWIKPDGADLLTYTIVTTQANDRLNVIHERMPVILNPAAEQKWLNPDLKDAAQLQPLLAPYASQKMDAYDVSPLVNSPRNDAPECVAPAVS